MYICVVCVYVCPICMCVYARVCVHVCFCVCMHMRCICAYICMHAMYACACMCACVCVCVCVRVCACVYLYVYVCMCVCVYNKFGLKCLAQNSLNIPFNTQFTRSLLFSTIHTLNSRCPRGELGAEEEGVKCLGYKAEEETRRGLGAEVEVKEEGGGETEGGRCVRCG